jgi:hypothetical protein
VDGAVRRDRDDVISIGGMAHPEHQTEEQSWKKVHRTTS